MAVLALGRLLGDSKHGADLRPGAVRPTGRLDRRGELAFDVVAPLGEYGDRPQTLGVSLVKLVD